ncbi:MAG: hypothetical protein F6K40_30330 [Okeania sp. SIO3I5]|uniref:hypothetical protein n=1 Tax=Okeania sp. SIO3I5 TaxID=2607805 RepID=UPI0013BAC7B6|nr:hypothetical protein [Okeania sp. SIO3I5]NEQ40304.1 hypothetical protein [Okeania sp. SIO3I5]
MVISSPDKSIEALSYHRNRFVENYLHNTSKLVVNYLVKSNIGTVVIGKNDNWKQGANIGKKNNSLLYPNTAL